MKDAVRKYFWNILIWLDEGANVILLAGEPDETVSLRAAHAKSENNRLGCLVCDLLDNISKDHCERVKRAALSRLAKLRKSIKE